jgi:hypothetical protein
VPPAREPSGEGSRPLSRHTSTHINHRFVIPFAYRAHFEFPVRKISEEKGLGTYGAEGFLVAHEVDDEGGRGDEEDLHEGVVQRDEVHEEVEVPHAKYQQVQLLSLTRKTYKSKHENGQASISLLGEDRILSFAPYLKSKDGCASKAVHMETYRCSCGTF